VPFPLLPRSAYEIRKKNRSHAEVTEVAEDQNLCGLCGLCVR
jgi:ferredoxin